MTLEIGGIHSEKFTITHKQIALFAEVTGDDNPVHLNDEAAKKVGFQGVLSHGILTGSVFSKIMGTKFPGNGTIYLSQTMKFMAPVYPDVELVATLKVIAINGRKISIETLVKDSSGNTVLEGMAEVLIPKKSQN